MQIESNERLSDCLAGHLNHAVSSANGPQFALMLSLAYEAQQTQSATQQNKPQENIESAYASIPLQMNQGLGLALQAANSAAFNLVNALYSERLWVASLDQVSAELPPEYPPEQDRRGKTQPLLETINSSKRFADRLSAA